MLGYMKKRQVGTYICVKIDCRLRNSILKQNVFIGKFKRLIKIYCKLLYWKVRIFSDITFYFSNYFHFNFLNFYAVSGMLECVCVWQCNLQRTFFLLFYAFLRNRTPFMCALNLAYNNTRYGIYMLNITTMCAPFHSKRHLYRQQDSVQPLENSGWLSVYI